MLGLGNAITLGFTPELGPELHTAANAASDPNGNEADATTGWSEFGLNGTGLNVFESQGAVKSAGNYAFHAECNHTPTAGARIQINVTVEIGKTYRISADWGHVGTGGQWNMVIEGAVVADSRGTSETELTNTTYDYTALDTDMRVNFSEGNASNDGGVYSDNISIREVL